jgi:hypothetical protein
MLSVQRLRSIGRVALTVAVAITPALAMEVTYNTTGTFNCSGAGSGCTAAGSVLSAPNGLTITYSGLFGATVAPPYPTNAQFGSFTAGAESGPVDPIFGAFTLLIAQTVPSPVGTATLAGQFAGTISTNSSNILLKFTNGSGTTPPPSLSSDPISGAAAYSFTIGDVTYWIDQRTPINPSSTGGGVSTINGAIEETISPEPSFLALTGAGFAGLLALALRRRSRIQS